MNNSLIKDYINKKIGKSKIIMLTGDVSQRIFYRIFTDKKSFIFMDSRNEKESLDYLINVYNIIKNIEVSVPKIFHCDKKNKFLILEDFGDKRFDKIINNQKYTYELLDIAVKSLVVLNKSVPNNKYLKKISYNINNFKIESINFIKYYYPFIWNKEMSSYDKRIFIQTWEETLNKITFNNNCFVHKDFFSNNLIYLPNKNNHLRCGIIDYQDAYFGDQALDFVSLFQDSRRLIKQDFTDDLINYYLDETKQKKDKEKFLIKYNILGAARQTRILGLWIQLYIEHNKKEYLKYINSTWYWLEKNLEHPFLKNLKELYYNLIPLKKRKNEN